MNKNEELSDKIKKALGNTDVSALLGMLSEKDKEVFSGLLKDKKARQELLASPEAQNLMEKLMGGR